jgi:hypothetical protein
LSEVKVDQAQDTYLCLNDPDAAYGQSYYGRDAHFSNLTLGDAFEVASSLVAKGVRRLILIFSSLLGRVLEYLSDHVAEGVGEHANGSIGTKCHQG